MNHSETVEFVFKEFEETISVEVFRGQFESPSAQQKGGANLTRTHAIQRRSIGIEIKIKFAVNGIYF